MELRHYGNFGLIGEHLVRLLEIQEMHDRGRNMHGGRLRSGQIVQEPEVVLCQHLVETRISGRVVRKKLGDR